MIDIYNGTLPRDLIENLSSNDQDLLDFVIGHWSVQEARSKGLDFQLTLGQEDYSSQMVNCTVKLIGRSKHSTFWLLNYQAKWPA